MPLKGQIIENNQIKDLTPEMVADLFVHMASDEQARFFNHVAEISTPWINFQLQYVTEDDGLNLHGRRVMQTIGDYSHWGLSCNLAKEIANKPEQI